MRLTRLLLLCLLPCAGLFAQLTPAEKNADFLQLAGLYDVNYAPYEWKLQVYGYDLLEIQPWLTQVQNAKTDLDFYDVLVRYVASLKDNHDEYILPSSFFADLHFSADLYDGNALIDRIDRSYLPAKQYPFQVGDQLISVDGVSVQDLITQFLPYAANGNGNPTLAQRVGVLTATYRDQEFYPYAANIADSATVVILRQSGATEVYTIPWDKQGIPITQVANIPPLASNVLTDTPARAAHPIGHPHFAHASETRNRATWNAWTLALPPAAPPQLPAYMAPLGKLRNMRAIPMALDFDRFTPVFNPPPGFHERLGANPNDNFLSGTFPVGTATVGLIRISTFEPADEVAALVQFANEIAYFQKNTSALVVDVMHNGGGDLCYTQQILQYLIPYNFRADGAEIRATLGWQAYFGENLSAAQEAGAPQWVTALYNAYIAELQEALYENRGLTGPLPVCGPSLTVAPAQDNKGNTLAYMQPIVLLTDTLTFSAADIFSAFLQDANRVTMLGERTAGAGGSVDQWDAGVYSEGLTRITDSLITRAQAVQNPGFPATLYVENTGVMPDILVPWNTTDNLLHGGRAFINAFIAAVQKLLQPAQSSSGSQ